MALPKISNTEEKVVGFVRDTIERSTRTIVDGFTNISDRIVASIGDKTKNMFGSIDLGDLLTASLAGSFLGKIGDKLGSVFGIGENRVRIENLLKDIKDATASRLDSLNKNINEFIREWKYDQEKENGFGPKEPTPENPEVPKPEKKGGLLNMALLFFRDLASLALRAVSLAAIGAAITGAVITGIKEWKIGEVIGDSLGLNNGLGGILNIIIGNAQESFMQKLARYGTYAAAGATIGIAGGLPGMIVGGMIGLATGVILDWVSDWIGKDKIYAFADQLTDSLFAGLDFILGTDVKRLEGRIKDLAKGKGNIEEMIVAKQKEIQDIEAKIGQARMEGKTTEVQKLMNLLEGTKKDLVDLQKASDTYDNRIMDLKSQIKHQQKNLLGKAADYSGVVLDYIYSMPLRAIDSVLALFTGDRIDNIWTADTDSAYTDSISVKMSNAVGKFVDDLVDSTVDAVVTFFTETLPKAFDDIGDLVSKKFSDVIAKLTELASTVVDEISYRDFLPESLGGNEKGLFDRVQEKIKENEKKLTENDDVRNNLSDSIVDNSSKITNNNNTTNNSVNAPVLNQQNVVNRNVTRVPNYTKNLDNTARMLETDTRGVPIGP
ncbi:hypothetical protein PP939_gp003 [Rhizobium phage RL38J1]|uniref:Uncharacterized protein n=1 Tax=Rhizobium phage RL38J1 TaxID=2663232 RepID=A0A6B9J1C7_9CAUD|nr:hypothetical protein PP939_gp003 [Rhizobium phage RL38J1]QGZ13840.1 hypothetical protein RL38J1_003 [Rhizobium phage RL38J1]